MTITYETERKGSDYRGLVVDLKTFDVLLYTIWYASAETAKSAAVSQWRAKQTAAQQQLGEQFAQALRA